MCASQPENSALPRLAANAPPVLLLEGGTEKSRMEMALYWAMLANCPEALMKAKNGELPLPCGTCLTCGQIKSGEYSDLWLFDGRITNREDEENPGLVKALRIENVRALKAAINTRPNAGGLRIAVISGISQTREEALNSLLKTLEEPGDFTRFVLLAPQRQQILPTLVSRSLCLTLPWSGCLDKPENESVWEGKLSEFLLTGKGFLDEIGARGAIDGNVAAGILLACQKSLARILAGYSTSPLDKAFAPLASRPVNAVKLGGWITEAQKMLRFTVNPVRVLEAFSTKMFLLIRNSRQREVS